MMRIAKTVVLAAAALAASTLTVSAQTISIQADVLKDWTSMKDTMAKIGEAMPEAKFGFKATPAERSYAEQILHIAEVNVGLLQSLGGKATPPMINMSATKKADVLKAMADSFDFGTALIKEFNDQGMLAAAPKAPPFLGAATRARVVYGLIGHTWDIYGQMVVYLRLNGGVPPASQRP
jgi:DinB superfamily